MKDLSQFHDKISYLLTDIDDTITDEGQLHAEAYQAMWKLSEAGIKVIPVTGRPAGWCEMIARVWPVAAVVGENGGFYFRYHNKKMIRDFYFDEKTQAENRKKLQTIRAEVLKEVPGCDIASDQFCRLMDLAVDFCEDVPALPKSAVEKIVAIFEAHGAQAKVSSIHVNGWFGDYNKVSMASRLLQKEFQVDAESSKKICAFSGDSPNDAPMFQYFPHSFAVANVKDFIQDLKYLPNYVSSSRGGKGFTEIAQRILEVRQR